MLRRVFEHIYEFEKNAPFPLQAVVELIGRELPRRTQEIEDLKKKLATPHGRIRRIRASIAWIYEKEYVWGVLRSLQQFNVRLNTALTMDHM